MSPERVLGGCYVEDDVFVQIVIWVEGKVFYPVIEIEGEGTTALMNWRRESVEQVIDVLMDNGIEPDWTDIYKDYGEPLN